MKMIKFAYVFTIVSVENIDFDPINYRLIGIRIGNQVL